MLLTGLSLAVEMNTNDLKQTPYTPTQLTVGLPGDTCHSPESHEQGDQDPGVALMGHWGTPGRVGPARCQYLTQAADTHGYGFLVSLMPSHGEIKEHTDLDEEQGGQNGTHPRAQLNLNPCRGPRAMGPGRAATAPGEAAVHLTVMSKGLPGSQELNIWKFNACAVTESQQEAQGIVPVSRSPVSVGPGRQPHIHPRGSTAVTWGAVRVLASVAYH